MDGWMDDCTGIWIDRQRDRIVAWLDACMYMGSMNRKIDRNALTTTVFKRPEVKRVCFHRMYSSCRSQAILRGAKGTYNISVRAVTDFSSNGILQVYKVQNTLYIAHSRYRDLIYEAY